MDFDCDGNIDLDFGDCGDCGDCNPCDLDNNGRCDLCEIHLNDIDCDCDLDLCKENKISSSQRGKKWSCLTWSVIILSVTLPLIVFVVVGVIVVIILVISNSCPVCDLGAVAAIVITVVIVITVGCFFGLCVCFITFLQVRNCWKVCCGACMNEINRRKEIDLGTAGKVNPLKEVNELEKKEIPVIKVTEKRARRRPPRRPSNKPITYSRNQNNEEFTNVNGFSLTKQQLKEQKEILSRFEKMKPKQKLFGKTSGSSAPPMF